jgi:type II secretory pathway component GspD/PulD (secretin)
MRVAFRAVVGFLAAAALTPAAQAQAPDRVTITVSGGAVFLGPTIVRGPGVTSIRVSTTAIIPDGGTVTLGSYSAVSESRSEFGAPVVGKIPYVSRGFRNVGYGRDVRTAQVTASVRIIDLREEEFRQTGFRSP